MSAYKLCLLALIIPPVYANNQKEDFVHPIAIENQHFADSVTHERFHIQGIDYQPGGSAAYTGTDDPLSDKGKCARDIFLMQVLGVNTVRVYTVNPDLNHDDCMTMLAAAGIYLVLDVNSPLVGESINRYEPWTTYTPEYLKHVFKVVDQFSRYNNTMAFFVGNEVVNDERSAAVSPPYIRAVTRDVKRYMSHNCPRIIPLGYSAADDLKFRSQLPHYLACGDSGSAVDFYGVNSYQWCGNQTMETSGYNTLIKDHKWFDFPVFLSEYGCNIIQPRLFQEVEALRSPAMTPYFDGGLVYEFSQEVNDYGLVTLSPQGNAYLRRDFDRLRLMFAKLDTTASVYPSTSEIAVPKKRRDIQAYVLTAKVTQSQVFSRTTRFKRNPQAKNSGFECRPRYPNLKGAQLKIPDTFGTDMISNGVKVTKGAYNLHLLKNMPESPYQVFDSSGEEIPSPRVKVVNDFSAHISECPWHFRKENFKVLASPALKTDKKRASQWANVGNQNGPYKIIVELLFSTVVALVSLFI